MLTSTGDRQYFAFLNALLEIDVNDELVMYASITESDTDTISYQGGRRKIDLKRGDICFIHYVPDDKEVAVLVYDGKVFAQKAFDYLVGNTSTI